MSFEYRFDRAEIYDSNLQDGFFRAKVRLTKPGVYPYILADGSVRMEAKTPEEIFAPAFLQTLNGAIVTDGHPYEFGGFVNAKNYKSLIKGIIVNPRKEFDPKLKEDFLIADEILFDKELIKEVLANEKTEVSLGVKANQKLESGFLNGNRFDSLQTGLIANHVAHVRKGRVGPDARTILDGIQYAIQGEMQMPVPEDKTLPSDEPSWVKKILEGFDKLFSMFSKPIVDASPGNSTKAEDKQVDVSVYQKQIEELKSVIDSLSQSLNLKLDEANQRELLIDQVKAVLPETNLKGLSNLEIKKELIKNQFPELKLDSSEQIDVYYNASLELAKAKAKINPSQTQNQEIRVDEVDIAALKAKRLNLYKETIK